MSGAAPRSSPQRKLVEQHDVWTDQTGRTQTAETLGVEKLNKLCVIGMIRTFVSITYQSVLRIDDTFISCGLSPAGAVQKTEACCAAALHMIQQHALD